MKKRIFKSSLLAVLTASLPLSVLATIVSCSNNANESVSKNENDLIQQLPLEPGITTIEKNESISKSPNIHLFNKMESRIVKDNIDRKINSQVYETELTKEFKNQFKYPGWNFNYESNGNRQQVIDGKTVDGMQRVWEERVDFNNQKVTYNNTSFILDEIANKRLKKHPAADLWFQQTISDQTKAVDKFFSIPSAVSGLTALGLYIPAGEIATLEFKESTLQKMKADNINNFKIVINSSFWDNKEPGNSGQISNRYPFVKTEFNVNINDVLKNGGKFEFGTPFGGTISVMVNSKIKSNSFNSFYESYGNFEFNVVGAIEMLSYVHGLTTEQDWNNQVKKVLDGTINAPAMSIDFPFGSMNIQSTAPKQFAYQPVDQIIFPYNVLEKWTSFLFISEFFASRDKNNNVKKIDFEFCDDIWGGAAAWGGGDILYSPLSWAKGSFLTGAEDWTINQNWGTFHEINHNFQQNSALFKKNSHPETNQVTMVNLSLLSDTGRWRNIYNPTSELKTGGWTRLQNNFSTIKHLKDNNYTSTSKNSEYELQSILLQTLGTFNFIDYVRNDVVTNPGTGGFSEILELSDYFKLNFWPALRDFSSWWTDGWPESDEAASADQKKEINRLNDQYTAFDFVGNIYSTGAYLYNSKDKKYHYTNDMQAPMDIAAAVPYVFDFEQGINSANKNFAWDKLNFKAETKLGGQLELDSRNKKKLIYIPPKNSVGQTDEFDVSITPSDFKNKPKNYVSEYIWKIKVRLVANLPVISLYNDPLTNNNSKDFSKEFDDYLKYDANIKTSLVSDPRLGILSVQQNLDKWHRVRISFDFIAPKDGTFDLQVNADSWMFAVDRRNADQIWWKAETVPVRNWISMGQVTLKAGERLPLDLYLTTKWNGTRLNLKAITADNQTYDVFNHSVVPWANKLDDHPEKFLDPKYAYKSRTLDLNNFQTSIYGLNTSRDAKMIAKYNGSENTDSNYTFTLKVPNENVNLDDLLSEKDNRYYEKWGDKNGKPYGITFDVNFKKAQKIGSIIFGHRTDNHWNARPTKIKISDQDGKVIYQGSYGAQFNDRGSEKSILNLDKTYEVTKLTFDLLNENLAGPNQSALILDSVQFSSQSYLKVNKVISVQDPAIDIYGQNWKLVANDPNVNMSAVNGLALTTSKEKEFIEFNLFAQGFDIVGQKGQTSQFDLYIDDKLVGTFDTANPVRLDNEILASYNSNNPDGSWMKVKIVNRIDKPLFINYFQTYGPEVYWNSVSKK